MELQEKWRTTGVNGNGRVTHLITFDSTISFQQNFQRYPVPVIIIVAPANNYAIIMEVFSELLDCIKKAVVGSNIVIHPAKNQ